MSKFISLLFFLLLGLNKANASTEFCHYVSYCKVCVIYRYDPFIAIPTSDPACFEKLKSLSEFDTKIPQNQSLVNNRPLSTQNDPVISGQLLTSIIKNSFESYKKIKDYNKFFSDIGNNLRHHHSSLVHDIKNELSKREEKENEERDLIKKIASDIQESISLQKTPLLPRSDISNRKFNSLFAATEIKAVEQEILNSSAHQGFPSIMGHLVPDRGGRERLKNQSITDPAVRHRHKTFLDYSDHFREGNASDASAKLIQEAQLVRNGLTLPKNSIGARTESFQASMDGLSLKQGILNTKLQSATDKYEVTLIGSSLLISNDLKSEAKSSFFSGDFAEGEHWVSVATSIVDIGLGFIPGVSSGKDLFEAITGKNIITGEKLGDWERAFSFISAGTLGTAGIAKKSMQILDKISDGLVASGKLDKVATLSKDVLRNESQVISRFKDRAWIKGEDLNESFRLEKRYTKEEFIRPWVPDRNVLEFTSTEDMIMYRVYVGDISFKSDGQLAEEAGRWFSKIDPRTMDKSELKRVLNLPANNDVSAFIQVQIPAGTRMRLGVVDYGLDGTKGGVAQYDLMGIRIDKAWIKDAGNSL